MASEPLTAAAGPAAPAAAVESAAGVVAAGGTATQAVTWTAAAQRYIMSLLNVLQMACLGLWHHLQSSAAAALPGSSSGKTGTRPGTGDGAAVAQANVSLPEDQRMACDLAVTVMTIPGDLSITFTFLAALLDAPSRGLGLTRTAMGVCGMLIVLATDCWSKYEFLRNCQTNTGRRDAMWTHYLVVGPFFKFATETVLGVQYNTPRLNMMVIASGLGLLEIPAGSFFIW
jgi:hypothetical protein